MALERTKLDGKVAIISGGARGVGRGIANALMEAGASTVLMDLDPAVAEVESTGGRAIGVVGSVMDRRDIERTVQTALDKFGRIDIVINNVGGAGAVPFFDLTEEKFLRDFHFNVISAFSLTQLAAPHMMKNGDGAVVNISSRSSELGRPGFTSYSVVKAGLEALTRMMARELAPKIRVNAISMGMIQTDALKNYLSKVEGALDKALPQIPLHRIGEIDDIGLAALYLCSKGCYATGAVLNIDGGIQKSISMEG